MSIFKRHIHQWKEIARTYAEPDKSLFSIKGIMSEDLERLVSGVTTILWECQDPKCRELRKEELLGKQVI